MSEAVRPQILSLVGGDHALRLDASGQWEICTPDQAQATLSLPRGQIVWLCRCGKSRQWPQCDGQSHFSASAVR